MKKKGLNLFVGLILIVLIFIPNVLSIPDCLTDDDWGDSGCCAIIDPGDPSTNYCTFCDCTEGCGPCETCIHATCVKNSVCDMDCTNDLECSIFFGETCCSGASYCTVLTGECNCELLGDDPTCDEGLCSGVTCNDGNLCTTDSCNPSNGQCEYVPKTCNDGNLCTTDSCNPSNGQCEYVPKTCNDGNLCTTDSCSSGNCVFTPKTCNDNVGCTTDTCSLDDGVCYYTDSCNPDFHCDTNLKVCVENDPPVDCDTALECNDDNLCTTDTCSGGNCVNSQKDCNDNNHCTIDSCNSQTGQCVNNIQNCDDLNDCTTDTCDSSSGSCRNLLIANCGKDCLQNTECDDEIYCNGQEECVSGTCINRGQIICDDGQVCTTDSCNEATQSCGFVENCGVGKSCNYQGICAAKGEECLGDGYCNDEDECTTDECVEGLCVYHESSTCGQSCEKYWWECDDGIECNGRENCVDGICKPGPGFNAFCNDWNSCTADSCLERWGQCVNTWIVGCDGHCESDSDCNDGIYCNGDERCGNADSSWENYVGKSECYSGTSRDGSWWSECSDRISCTMDVCDESTDSCLNIDECSDGRVCGGDGYSDGECILPECYGENGNKIYNSCGSYSTKHLCNSNTCEIGGETNWISNFDWIFNTGYEEVNCYWDEYLNQCSEDRGIGCNDNGVCETDNDENCINCYDCMCIEDYDGDGESDPWDCDDLNPDINSWAQEICDGIDNNCDDIIDPECECSQGNQVSCGIEVGLCTSGTQTCIEGLFGICLGNTGPFVEICGDRIDQDCDGADLLCLANVCSNGDIIPCGIDTGLCQKGTQTCDSNGDWEDCIGSINPTTETCDEEDNNCDGIVDEGCTCTDGQNRVCGSNVGLCEEGSQICSGGVWGSCIGMIGPIAEICEDGEDQDCDGIDESCTGGNCNLGDTQSCGSNVGLCEEGSQTCNTNGNWEDCTGGINPTTETCDGEDNNCDGTVDEGCTCTDGQNMVCGSNVGLCEEGSQTCSGGVWGSCIGMIGPIAEICEDGEDQDCDGIDESCNNQVCLEGQIRNCGIGIGECVMGEQSCGSDGQWGNCVGDVSPTTEICDSRDNNCNGEIDEGCDCEENQIRICGINTGTCESGTQTCIGGIWGSCENEINFVLEICDDGLDNNCDGVIDESCGGCTDEQIRICGSNFGECVTGNQTCLGGVWGGCLGSTWPLTEICDGLDNDCDGVTDEGCQPCNPLEAQNCGIDTGECTSGIQICRSDNLWGSCQAYEGPSPEICDGLDNDCNGEIDEGRVCDFDLDVDSDGLPNDLDLDDDNDGILDRDDDDDNNNGILDIDELFARQGGTLSAKSSKSSLLFWIILLLIILSAIAIWMYYGEDIKKWKLFGTGKRKKKK
jgi:hypothetical protein